MFLKIAVSFHDVNYWHHGLFQTTNMMPLKTRVDKRCAKFSHEFNQEDPAHPGSILGLYFPHLPKLSALLPFAFILMFAKRC